MDTRSLPIVYLSVLVILLMVGGWFLFRQILRTRKVETTLNRLQSKLSKDKGTAQEYYELGAIFLEKRLYSQAIAQFQKALKAKDAVEPENIALVYNALGYTYAAQEQYDLAIRQYKEALDRQPQYVTALNNLGFAYEKKQLISSAIETYEAVLKVDAKNSTAKRRSESLKKLVSPT
jgi:tetratricopeptide (TPR) repeat protein